MADERSTPSKPWLSLAASGRRWSRRDWLRRGAVAAGALLAGSMAARAASANRLSVVASFSILADMVRQVAGDTVDLAVIVPAGRDPHTFEPTPSDARALRTARVLVANGLGFEFWLPRLLQASGFRGEEIVASRGVAPRFLGEAGYAHGGDHPGHDAAGMPSDHRAGAEDPHAWQDLANGIVYVRNIAEGLATADPAHAAEYRARAAAYIAELHAADARWREALAAVPAQRRVLVTSHDAFGYFGAAYGIEVLSVVGLSSEAEPSARAMADLIREIRAHHITALFLERGAPSRALRRIAQETGVRLDGTLYADTLDAPGGAVTSYLGMFEWNTRQMLQAFRAS